MKWWKCESCGKDEVCYAGSHRDYPLDKCLHTGTPVYTWQPCEEPKEKEQMEMKLVELLGTIDGGCSYYGIEFAGKTLRLTEYEYRHGGESILREIVRRFNKKEGAE